MTAQQLAAKMRARAQAVEPEFKKATASLAAEALRFCRGKITEEIYAKPVPTREQVNAERRHASGISSGRIAEGTKFQFTPTAKKGSRGSEKAWRRTGNLRRGEEPRIIDSYTAAIVNVMNYALPRHEAGKPGRRKTRYPAHWRDELVAALPQMRSDAYRRAVEAILKRGI